MTRLIKIRDVSNKYDISARTLRYYEDMGLIASTRTDDYAYRLYDEKALKRLEQILILRKLNISIRDIQRIFSDEGAAVVLSVLQQKVEEIDGEVPLCIRAFAGGWKAAAFYWMSARGTAPCAICSILRRN
ncbi:MAG: MerR family transcriptional regulator [Clostridiales bacterium]|nr:MerR family transcriptional regulator [Clostridiales bacterium]